MKKIKVILEQQAPKKSKKVKNLASGFEDLDRQGKINLVLKMIKSTIKNRY